MNRVLIVAGERQTGERYQQALGQEGFQTAVVWNPIPNGGILPPAFSGLHGRSRPGGTRPLRRRQAVRGISSNVPFLGLASTANQQLFDKARAAGFIVVYRTHDSSRPDPREALRREIRRLSAPAEAEVIDVVGRDPSLNRLRELARDMVQTTAALRHRVTEYGEDGPELFGYIENSGIAIRKKLNGVADFRCGARTPS